MTGASADENVNTVYLKESESLICGADGHLF
jgi:hypothetical protein